MGFGNPYGGSYNLEEMLECEKRGITFLHSYHYDPKLTVYFDGTNPANIDITSQHHGNIYDTDTLKKYIPDRKTRELLKIKESLMARRSVIGDTMDFLRTVENIIDAPWPIHIHCKGGRHKTGMLGIMFEFLAYKQSMDERYRTSHSVSDLQRGILFKEFELSPAEVNYLKYNSNVYRHENIEFMRRITSGEFMTNPGFRKKWDTIVRKFNIKVRRFKVSIKFTDFSL